MFCILFYSILYCISILFCIVLYFVFYSILFCIVFFIELDKYVSTNMSMAIVYDSVLLLATHILPDALMFVPMY